MFVNYFADPVRRSPVNLLVARIGIGAYVIWKLLSYDFHRLHEWPDFVFRTHEHGVFLPSPNIVHYLQYEVGLAIVLMIAFAVGYRLRIVCSLAPAILLHLAAIHYVVTNSGTTFLPVSYSLVIWGLFRDDDVTTFDARRRKTPVLHAVECEFAMRPLQWLLVVFAATYFFTGYCKLLNVGAAWVHPTNLQLMISREALMHLDELPNTASLILRYDWLATLSTLSTIVVECGFLIAVLTKRSITWFVIGAAALHTMILLTMGILFFDQYVIMLLFVPWDELRFRLSMNRGGVAVTQSNSSRKVAA